MKLRDQDAGVRRIVDLYRRREIQKDEAIARLRSYNLTLWQARVLLSQVQP